MSLVGNVVVKRSKIMMIMSKRRQYFASYYTKLYIYIYNLYISELKILCLDSFEYKNRKFQPRKYFPYSIRKKIKLTRWDTRQ